METREIEDNSPIIFLDVDGVLNCQLFYTQRGEFDMDGYPLSEICKDRISWLNELCKETGAKVVISSTWRQGRTLEQLQHIFTEVGATFDIIDKTPCYARYKGSCRGNEIKGWIDENRHWNFKNYAIIDDDSDMLYQQRHNFFQTDNYSGLTPNTCYRIKNFLIPSNQFLEGNNTQ